MKRLVAAALLICLCGPVNAAESLIVGLSSDYVRISSSFTGTELVLFGAVEATDDVVSTEGRDIVIVVRGPGTEMTVRQKTSVGGLWINASAVAFSAMPGFYYVASTRPLNEIAAPAVLQRYQLGTANLAFTVEKAGGADVADIGKYAEAAVRLNSNEGTYYASTNDIVLTGGSLFQTRVPMPASVPVGNYRAEVYLFRNGQVISAYSAPIYVDKSGLERWLYGFAHDNTVLYGLAAVLMALAIGWLAATAFRER